MADDWRTPPEVFGPLNKEFAFDLDAAANYGNTLCPRFLSDALTVSEWPGERIFCNPPYGRMTEQFVRRAADEADRGKTVVCLIPVRTRAAWWHECVLARASEIRFIRKRVTFRNPSGGQKREPTFDSCIVVFGRGRPLSIATFLQSEREATRP
jgi:site-specific DNA-methyltransferase (adenine-specific)